LITVVIERLYYISIYAKVSIYNIYSDIKFLKLCNLINFIYKGSGSAETEQEQNESASDIFKAENEAFEESS